MGSKLRRHDPEFKREAVRLLEAEGRNLRDVAEGLGLRPETLRQWQLKMKAHPDNPFPGPGRPKKRAEEGPATELGQLRQEIERLHRERDQLRRQRDNAQMDRDILKKALAIFSELDP